MIHVCSSFSHGTDAEGSPSKSGAQRTVRSDGEEAVTATGAPKYRNV
jgi:hypothetical protein